MHYKDVRSFQDSHAKVKANGGSGGNSSIM